MAYQNLFAASCVVCISLCLVASSAWAQDEKTEPATVYSGPQVGELLPKFTMKYGYGEHAGKEVDLIDSAGDNPVVMIFVHKRSRPAFGLANTVMRYCKQEGGDKLTRGICFLSADPTDTQNWMGKIKNYFPEGIPVGFSAEGIEGPGSYGLNRNVELTVLVANKKKVTANFALVQPGAHVDGPKILAAIAKAIGSDEIPNINKYLNSNQAIQDAPIAIDPGLMKQIRQLNAKDATPEKIAEAIAEIETMIEDNQPLQNQLGSILAGWTRKNRIDAIGNQEQQDQLKNWAKEFAPRMNRKMDRKRPSQGRTDSKLTELLRAVIQKSNSDEQVDVAASAVEKYVDANPASAKELARITTTVVNSDKISNYGTAHCQEVIKAWAEKYGSDKK